MSSLSEAWMSRREPTGEELAIAQRVLKNSLDYWITKPDLDIRVY